MGRNIVVCSDGTGNTFDNRVTNVTGLIGCIILDVDRQLVLYDQGIGTTATRTSQVDLLGQSTAEPRALRVLPAPGGGKPLGWVKKARGLATGYGLKENVGQIYLALAGCYQPGDRVFLFGFSRGAFTVRALAGLLYRCHLPYPRPEIRPPASTARGRRSCPSGTRKCPWPRSWLCAGNTARVRCISSACGTRSSPTAASTLSSFRTCDTTRSLPMCGTPWPWTSGVPGSSQPPGDVRQ
jgi:hypothetical protein